MASCFDIRGRLRVNANMRMYVWPVGTDRLLAVHYRSDAPEPDPPLPADLAKIVDENPGADIFGELRVCPFTQQAAGKLRIVCVDRASHLVARQSEGNGPRVR